MKCTLCVAASLGLSVVASMADGDRPKLIEFGWDEPDTAFMREHIREMEKTPFDGCVFHIMAQNDDGTTSPFVWECWGKKTFAREQLAHAIEDLKALDSESFDESFLRFNVTPADLDWFDDFSAVLSNARLAAEVAHEGGCPGILFDIESYNAQLWHYPGRPAAATRSWDEYAEQARLRGREVMAAFQEPFDDIVIFLTFGYSLPWVQSGGKPEGLKEASYGLLAPFLDGMLEAAGEDVRFVDGFELAYAYKQREQFEAGRKMMKEDVLPIVAHHVEYRRHFGAGFGIWMDENWRELGWSVDDLSKNYFQPDEFRESLRSALELCDGYVWIYTETPRWWGQEGAKDLPEAYDRAARAALAGVGK